jgi:hypothetical protein
VTTVNETEALVPAEEAERKVDWAWVGAGLVLVLALAWLTKYLDKNVPSWLADTSLNRVAKSVEYHLQLFFHPIQTLL